LKLVQHIRYFWYIASNWGLSIGLFSLYHEIRGERKYNINTTSYSKLSQYKLAQDNLKHATEYMPANYSILEHLFMKLPDDAFAGRFLDIGCGKGRAICVATHVGFTAITGIDFAKELIVDAEKNIQQTKQFFPAVHYNLLWKDISTFEIEPDTTTFFLFNPFDEVMMKTVVKKIIKSQKQYPRPVYVMYASPRFEYLFFEAGFDVLARVKKLNFLEGVLLCKPK
jgi:SAM-dependent methyltransferase